VVLAIRRRATSFRASNATRPLRRRHLVITIRRHAINFRASNATSPLRRRGTVELGDIVHRRFCGALRERRHQLIVRLQHLV
jgi:hypothetical protein